MDRAEITARAASATLSVARSAGLAVHSAKLIGGYTHLLRAAGMGEGVWDREAAGIVLSRRT